MGLYRKIHENPIPLVVKSQFYDPKYVVSSCLPLLFLPLFLGGVYY